MKLKNKSIKNMFLLVCLSLLFNVKAVFATGIPSSLPQDNGTITIKKPSNNTDINSILNKNTSPTTIEVELEGTVFIAKGVTPAFDPEPSYRDLELNDFFKAKIVDSLTLGFIKDSDAQGNANPSQILFTWVKTPESSIESDRIAKFKIKLPLKVGNTENLGSTPTLYAGFLISVVAEVRPYSILNDDSINLKNTTITNPSDPSGPSENQPGNSNDSLDPGIPDNFITERPNVAGITIDMSLFGLNVTSGKNSAGNPNGQIVITPSNDPMFTGTNGGSTTVSGNIIDSVIVNTSNSLYKKIAVIINLLIAISVLVVIGLFIYYMILLGSPSSDEGERSFYLYCLGWAAASLALLGAIGTIYWMFTAMIK